MSDLPRVVPLVYLAGILGVIMSVASVPRQVSYGSSHATFFDDCRRFIPGSG